MAASRGQKLKGWWSQPAWDGSGEGQLAQAALGFTTRDGDLVPSIALLDKRATNWGSFVLLAMQAAVAP